MGDELEYCRKCGLDKPRDAFYSLGHTTRVRQPCKDCHTAGKRAAYAARGGDRVSHAQVLREKYRITPGDYERMLTEQGGRCAICGEAETALGRGGRPRRLAVDHDRRTGAVRRLLCHRCNLITGAVEENPALLDRVRNYLLAHGVGGTASGIDQGR